MLGTGARKPAGVPVPPSSRPLPQLRLVSCTQAHPALAPAPLQDNLGSCALLEACKYGHDELVTTLRKVRPTLSCSCLPPSAQAEGPSSRAASTVAMPPRAACPCAHPIPCHTPFSYRQAGASLDGHKSPVEQAAVLCTAVFDGDLPQLRRLLRAGARVDAGDYDKRTGLHIAAAEGNLQAVRLMIEEAGADPGGERWAGGGVRLRAGCAAATPVLRCSPVAMRASQAAQCTRPTRTMPPCRGPAVTDRWGHTPMDEALRVGAGPVVRYFSSLGISATGNPATADGEDDAAEAPPPGARPFLTAAEAQALQARLQAEPGPAEAGSNGSNGGGPAAGGTQP